MTARLGQSVSGPSSEGGVRKPALPEMDDLEQLLNIGGRSRLQAPAATERAPAAQQGGNPLIHEKFNYRRFFHRQHSFYFSQAWLMPRVHASGDPCKCSAQWIHYGLYSDDADHGIGPELGDNSERHT